MRYEARTRTRSRSRSGRRTRKRRRNEDRSKGSRTRPEDRRTSRHQSSFFRRPTSQRHCPRFSLCHHHHHHHLHAVHRLSGTRKLDSPNFDSDSDFDCDFDCESHFRPHPHSYSRSHSHFPCYSGCLPSYHAACLPAPLDSHSWPEACLS